MGLRFWRKAPPSIEFVREGLDDRFAEACERLGVKRVSALNIGPSHNSRGALVETADAQRHWLKIYGVSSPNHPGRLAEIASDALSSICKPRLLKQIEWQHGNANWIARLTTLADDAVEQAPWAGDAAAAVTDAWLQELKANLDRLVPQPSARILVSPQMLSGWLSHNYRLHYIFSSSEWVTSHNDLQWSNLTAPTLYILDWEHLGSAPIGYDIGWFIACSCRDPALVRRLEKIFASHFSTATGLTARLFATHRLKQHAQENNLDPEFIADLDDMIARLLNDLRALPDVRKSTVATTAARKWVGLKRRLAAALAD